MHRSLPVLFDIAACADARTAPVASPQLNSDSWRTGPRLLHYGVRGNPVRAALLALLLVLPTSVAPALAQPARIANEYDGKNHQPTPAEVSKADENAGLNPAPAGGTDARSVDQLNKQLLHDEAVDPPTNPASPVPVR